MAESFREIWKLVMECTERSILWMDKKLLIMVAVHNA